MFPKATLHSATRRAGSNGYSFRLAALALLLLLGAGWGQLFAQTNLDEYSVVKYYELPKTAVPFSALTEAEGIWLQDGQPFSGIAYERFANQRLQRVFNLFQGKQQGPSYLWYPDGAPLMSANYRLGALQGRFLGWYQNGGVIYDMVLNHGAYSGDYIDDDRAQAQIEDTEGEGDAATSDKE